MRVQNPDQYAAVLLNITEPNEHYTPEKIRSMYGHSEIDLKFPTPIPVNITYQTAFVDDAGKLQFRKDVYGRDATMLSLLRSARGKDLENVVAHSQPSYSRPPGSSLPAGVSFASDNTLLLRTVVLRTAVRAADHRPPRSAGAARRSSGACSADLPVNSPLRVNSSEKSTASPPGGVFNVNHCPPGFQPVGTFSPHSAG